MTPAPSPRRSDVRSFEQVVRARRMIRAFSAEPIHRNELDAVLELARRAPAAGNTSAVEFLVLDTEEAVARYWATTMTPEKQASFRWQSLLRAPALVIVVTRPDAYVQRYAEPDKARARLGTSLDGWAQPFWWIDAGMVVQNLLLAATDRELAASLFGVFDHEVPLRSTFGIPDDRRLVATIALGHPAADEPGRSANRPRPDLADVVHRGSWPTGSATPPT